MYGLVEIDILTDMARRISTYDYFIPAAQHQMQKLQELGMVQSEIIKRLSALTGQTQSEIVSLLSEASAEAVEDDVEYYTRAEVYEPSKVNTEALHAQLNSGLLQTQGAFFNITRTTANTASKQFERALDRAWTQITSGAFDYNTAIKGAITSLANDGIGSIEYKSGRVDNIEVAVRRAVVTGANQTAARTQEVLADELEVDLVEVTAHGGARPSHAKWQGQVFSRKGRVTIDGVTYEDLAKATGYGRADGLCGVNCRHNFHPYVPGTSRTWSDKQLEALEEKKVEYNGEKLTEYEASQVQRKIEREIRKQKRTVEALEAAGLDSSAERKKLREAQKTYTDFSEQTGMRKQSARTQIASAKAEREVRAANRAAGVKPSTEKSIEKQRKETQTPLTNRGNSGIISNVESPIEQDTKTRTPEPRGSSMWTEEKRTQLRQTEKILSGNQQETAVVYDADGNVAFKKKGTKNAVSFTKGEFRKLKDTVVTHNHPNNSCFSSEDIDLLKTSGAAEIRATTKFGTYSLKPPKKWDDSIARFEEIDKIYNDFIDAAIMTAKDQAAKAGESWIHYLHNAEVEGTRAFADAYGFEFTFEVE